MESYLDCFMERDIIRRINSFSEKEINMRIECLYLEGTRKETLGFTKCWSFIHHYIDPILKKEMLYNDFYTKINDATTPLVASKILLKLAYMN